MKDPYEVGHSLADLLMPLLKILIWPLVVIEGMLERLSE